MKIGIVGWGVEGQSAFNYFGPDHSYLIANEEPRDDFPNQNDKIKVQSIGSAREPGLTGNVDNLSYLEGIENCDKIVCTPTAYKNLEKKYPKTHSIWPKVTSDKAIFFETVKTRNIIGVTGTKGKGTTSTLIAKLLEAHGKTVFLGGNIGKSPLDFVKDVQTEDWVVLELANFQLYSLAYSPHIAVCLMVVPEHLDWHPNFEEYLEAKANIFRYQKPDDIAVYFSGNENSTKLANYSAGKKVPYYKKPGAYVKDDGKIVIGENEKEIIHKSEVKLPGVHNLQNVCAACTAVYEVIGNLDHAREVLTTFSGLEHRLELVRELSGVKYYDDSFATTPDSVIVALRAVTRPVVLILGGHDKGLDYRELVEEVAGRGQVRHVITIGEIGPKLAQALRDNGFNSITEDSTSIKDIVIEAKSWAQTGDAVLLSCGTSSFGMFKDYKDRGEQFKQAVLSLT